MRAAVQERPSRASVAPTREPIGGRDARFAVLWLAGASYRDIGAELRLSISRLKQLRRALRLPPRPVGQPPKHPPPEPRACDVCATTFVPKNRSASGKQCNEECRIEALRRNARENRKHPEPQVRQCKHCGERFLPRAGGADPDFCSRAHYDASEVKSAHGGATLGARNERVFAELERIKRERGLVGTAEAGERLGVTAGKVANYYVAEGILEVERVVVDGTVFLLFKPSELDRFIREWVRGGDGRRRRWLDDELALAVWRGHGWLAALSERRGLSEAEAEAIVRDRVKRRRERLLRHRRGRRLSGYVDEWEELFEEKRAELEAEYDERAELELLAPGEQRPTRWHVAAAVAELDFAEHPERWAGYAHAPGDARALHRDFARSAAQRVLNALEKRWKTRTTK